jgi:hypothetical protein
MLSDGCCAIDGMWSSSVIKIVKMKYNRINIKWWLVSTSFKIYLDILSYMYITFTIFYYNTISLKCTCFPVLVKGLYQTESYSLHVMQLINTHLNHRRKFLFSTPCGVGSLLCMRTINCKPHWLPICCLSRIFFSRSTVQKLENNMMNIVCQSCKQ